MTRIGSITGGIFGLCHLGAGGRGIVGVTIGVGVGDPVTQLQHLFEVSDSDVQLLWIGEDRPLLDDRGGVGHQQVWAEGEGRGRGAPTVSIAL